MFFAVLWQGIRQAFAWFFGLFGYKRDGKFAKCVWGVFAASAATIMAILAVVLICDFYDYAKDKWFYHKCACDEYDYWKEDLSRDVEIKYNSKRGHDVINTHTGKVTISGVSWYVEPDDCRDSLVVYSDGEKRGYFSKNTGEVIIAPQYSRAWVFSSGLASVEENGVIKFIDQQGNQAFDRTFKYQPGVGLVFHDGYCIIDSDDDGLYGVMNTRGETVIEEISDEVKVSDSAIFITMKDNTIRRYDKNLNITDDFYIRWFDHLSYEDEYGDTHRAKLCYYIAGRDKYGLMTLEGKVMTLPEYEDIEAVGEDSYLCTLPSGYQKILNGSDLRRDSRY